MTLNITESPSFVDLTSVAHAIGAIFVFLLGIHRVAISEIFNYKYIS